MPGVILHAAVLEIEAFQVGDGSCFDVLGKTECLSTKLGHLITVKSKQDELILDG
jgi:hypothetical protein